MKTIIIHRRYSQEFLDRYQVLFQPFIEAGQIDFCFWDESASDFASALPDLPGKIRGERTWRALVVLPVEASDSENGRKNVRECREDNPFDFLVNSNDEPVLEENKVPLVRLAQMLGGIPLVTPHVKSTFTQIADEIQKGTMESVSDAHYEYCTRIDEDDDQLAELQKKWNALNDKYSTNCVLPTTIYLFKGRIVSDIVIPETTDKDLEYRHENDSSLFWYRNSYPAKIRFLTKDFCRPGNAHYHEDLFSFWMTALTLAINDFPTGTFEAYKLYDTEAVVSQEKLLDIFSRYYNRLDRIAYSAYLKIIEFQKDAQFVRESDALPNYKAKIPVIYRHMDDTSLFISGKKIGLVNDLPIEEEPWWYHVAKASRKALDKLISSTKPVLDHASQSCIAISKVTEEELVELDEYQFEEMEEELAELESEILTFTRSGALPIRLFRRMLNQRTAETGTRMRKHVSQKIAAAAVGTAAGIYLVGYLPDLIYQAVKSHAYTPALAALIGIALIILTALGTLFWFRHGVRQKINNYNGTLYHIIAQIQDSANRFSEYLSDCCSYMRGRSMLQTLSKRAMVSLSGIKQMTEHSEQLKEYMGMITSWLSDFNMVPLKAAVYEGAISFDFDIPPSRNQEYQLSNRGEVLDIPSVGGSECKAPYPFVTEFRAIRVPVFEKAHYDAPEVFILPGDVAVAPQSGRQNVDRNHQNEMALENDAQTAPEGERTTPLNTDGETVVRGEAQQ